MCISHFYLSQISLPTFTSSPLTFRCLSLKDTQVIYSPFIHQLVSSHGLDYCMEQWTQFNSSNIPWKNSFANKGTHLVWWSHGLPVKFQGTHHIPAPIFSIFIIYRFKLKLRLLSYLSVLHIFRSHNLSGFRQVQSGWYDFLLSLQTPITFGDLSQLVHGANWILTAVPGFSDATYPLYKHHESYYIQISWKNHITVSRRPLLSWGHELQAQLSSLLRAIKYQVTLSLTKPEQRLCLFTGASNKNWAGFLTQVATTEYIGILPSKEYDRSPIWFLSGSLKNYSLLWRRATPSTRLSKDSQILFLPLHIFLCSATK